jgi:hypothetical protein
MKKQKLLIIMSPWAIWGMGLLETKPTAFLIFSKNSEQKMLKDFTCPYSTKYYVTNYFKLGGLNYHSHACV